MTRKKHIEEDAREVAAPEKSNEKVLDETMTGWYIHK